MGDAMTTRPTSESITYPEVLRLVSREASLLDAMTLDAAVRIAVEHWSEKDTLAYGTAARDRLSTYTVRAVQP